VNLLHRELTLNQRRLGIDPTTARRVTLDATWAVIIEAHDFFARTTSKADLRRERPLAVKSGLGSLIQDLGRGIPKRLAGFPAEWDGTTMSAPAPKEASRKREEAPGPPGGNPNKYTKQKNRLCQSQGTTGIPRVRRTEHVDAKNHQPILNTTCKISRL
jgi:hypothetical protein